MSDIVIYETENGAVSVRLDSETVWLSQAQMIALFDRDQSVIFRHIRNVFNEGELPEESNMQKMHSANSDKPTVVYSLDVIISVGYRVKSIQGTRFRQWATSLLKEHLTQGYTQTFLWLQRYDEGLLTEPAGSPGGLLPSLEQARSALDQLKSQLLTRHEATDLFARERGAAWLLCWATWTKACLANPLTRPSKPRPPTCCISW